MKFKQGIDANQEFLLPKKPSEFLPENHLAKAVRGIVELLDLTKIEAKYSKTGWNAFNPRIMISILFYGYSVFLEAGQMFFTAYCTEEFL